MVVLVLHTLSLLTMSLVTSTSASTKLLCFRVISSSRSVLMVERFLAMILALIAAIFSTDMASDSDLREEWRRFTHFNSSLLKEPVCVCCCGETQQIDVTYLYYGLKWERQLYLIWSVCTIPSLWPSKRAARRSLSRRTRSSSYRWNSANNKRFTLQVKVVKIWFFFCLHVTVSAAQVTQLKHSEWPYLNPWFFGLRRHLISCSFDYKKHNRGIMSLRRSFIVIKV